MKGATITLDMGQLLNAEPVMGKTKNDVATNEYDFTEVDSNGITIPTWKIEGVLNLNNSDDRTNFTNLCKCAVTKGIKKIEADITDGKTASIIKYSLYAVANSVSYIYVKISHISFTDPATSNLVRYNIECVETGGLSTNYT